MVKLSKIRRCEECGARFKARSSSTPQRFCNPLCRMRAASRRGYRAHKQRTTEEELKVPPLRAGPNHNRYLAPQESQPGDGAWWQPAGNDGAYLAALAASGGRWA
jgi:hypothetical protein